MTAETVVAEQRDPLPKAPVKRKGKRRRPVRRFMVVTHRWLSLILGVVLIVICTTGAILVLDPQIHHALNSQAFASSGGPARVTMQEAKEVVAKAHPDFAPTTVIEASGVLSVTDYTTAWNVDPATGKILGHVKETPAWLKFTENLHECFLTCEDYPGYIPALNAKIPHTGWLNSGDEGDDITYGNLVLGLFGVVLLYLSLTGLWLWFPRPKRIKEGFTVRWSKGRFARDTDLHKVIGVFTLLPLLMWGVTGAGFELGPVKKAWYAALPGEEITGDQAGLPASLHSTKSIGEDTAVRLAEKTRAGSHAVTVSILAKGDTKTAYDVWLADGFDPYGRTDSPGDIEIAVDQHTGATTVEYGYANESATQTIWNTWNYPVHSGFIVDGWWRSIWVVVGLAPLALMITGVSTWLVRHRSARRRRQAARGRTRTA